MTTASRGAGRLLLAAAMFTITLTAVWTAAPHEEEMAAFVGLVGVAALLMAMLTVLAPFDFRGDVDQIALLKTLPAPAWRLALGQVLDAGAGFHADSVGGPRRGAMVRRPAGDRCCWRPPRSPRSIISSFSAWKTCCFWSSRRAIAATTPADLQAMGRNVLSQFAKMVGMGGAGVVAAVAGVLVYFLTGSNMWAAAAAAWLAAAAVRGRPCAVDGLGVPGL